MAQSNMLLRPLKHVHITIYRGTLMRQTSYDLVQMFQTLDTFVHFVNSSDSS